MAEFRGVLSGNRGNVSRLGSKNSGISAHIRSWNNDVYATLIKDDDGKDVLNLTIPNNLRVNLNHKLLIVKDGVLVDDSLKKDGD
jgi:hypothetical protein